MTRLAPVPLVLASFCFVLGCAEKKPRITKEAAREAGPAALVEFYQCARCHSAEDQLEPAPLEKSCVRARAIADHFRSGELKENLALSPGDPEAGRSVMARNGCAKCHRFSGVPAISPEQLPVDISNIEITTAIKLAPDHRYTRERMTPASLRTWLKNPRKMKPDTLMPEFQLSEEEIQNIAATIMNAKLEAPSLPDIPARLPPLDRKVEYAEVEKEVFRHVCWHCHADPEPVGGDGGPGNTGGFGFSGKAIDLSGRRAILRGGQKADGDRIDLFAPNEEGVPLLVESMMARYSEIAGLPIEGVLGMPLGLPPMSLEKIQLVETWIAQRD